LQELPIKIISYHPGRNNNRVQGFLARNIPLVQPPKLDENEVLESAFFTIPEVLKLIRTCEFSSAMHVALFYRAMQEIGVMRFELK